MVAIGIVVGAVLGISLAYYIVMRQLKSSNDLGDSKNVYENVAKQPFVLKDGADRVHRATYEQLFPMWAENLKKSNGKRY